MLLFLTFYLSINPPKMYQIYKAAQLYSTLIATKKNYWAINQHIQMISEEPCNTQTGAGYRSQMFNIDIDTSTSIPVPEWYFFQYQFY